MDLLTRGAGFGYIGSTITSLIYASFTFIFFALEAAIMAYALELAFDIPPAWGYLLCARGGAPAGHARGDGDQPAAGLDAAAVGWRCWCCPTSASFEEHPGVLEALAGYGGDAGLTGFDARAFGAAMTVGIALFTQMGEQADYLRFMPEAHARPTARRWWTGVHRGRPRLGGARAC